jgi:acetyl-CoA acyltransferase
VNSVVIAGVGMTRFRRDPSRGVRNLAVAAARGALLDAGSQAAEIEKIFFGNAAAGLVSYQEMVRGQVAFRGTEFAGIPLINIDNACASGSSALHLAWQSVASGAVEVALAVGAEQLSHEDKARTFNALRGSTDVEEIGEPPVDVVASNSVLMEFYAEEAASYLAASDATVDDFALVAVKNRRNAAHNPLAQFQNPQTSEAVLASRTIVPPLTLPMCSPVSDGAAAIVLSSPNYAARRQSKTVEILASELRGGAGIGRSPVTPAAMAAYEASGLGPDDLDVIELHDAAAPAELLQYGEIGLCAIREGHHLVRCGATDINGRIPVNTSGGLLSRGHPLGATGCAQVVELYAQLLGRANGRQVHDARLAMALNAGGWIGGTYATAVATVLGRNGDGLSPHQ